MPATKSHSHVPSDIKQDTNRSSSRVEAPCLRFSNVVNLIGLEQSLEHVGQEWIENVNIIEQLLVRVVDRTSQEHPHLKCRLIVRRLPTYLVKMKIQNADNFD